MGRYQRALGAVREAVELAIEERLGTNELALPGPDGVIVLTMPPKINTPDIRLERRPRPRRQRTHNLKRVKGWQRP